MDGSDFAHFLWVCDFFHLIASLAEMGMKFSFEFKMSLTLLCITSVLHFEPNDKVYLGSSSHVLLWSEFKSYTFKAENANFDHLWCMFESLCEFGSTLTIYGAPKFSTVLWYVVVNSGFLKVQLISKQNCRAITSPKKRTLDFYF